MPYYDFLCPSCGHVFEDTVSCDVRSTECRCGEHADRLPALIGGYQGNMGGSSTRPKNSTAMPKAKVFTGNPPEKADEEK